LESPKSGHFQASFDEALLIAAQAQGVEFNMNLG
jgi:hypothetical protein